MERKPAMHFSKKKIELLRNGEINVTIHTVKEEFT